MLWGIRQPQVTHTLTLTFGSFHFSSHIVDEVIELVKVDEPVSPWDRTHKCHTCYLREHSAVVAASIVSMCVCVCVCVWGGVVNTTHTSM